MQKTRSTAAVRQAAAFRVALHEFPRKTEQAARRSGLTPQGCLLLLLVKGAEDGSERATISELGKQLHLAQSTVTQLAICAAQAGLVRRGTSPVDGRVVYVQMTGRVTGASPRRSAPWPTRRRALHEIATKLDV